MTQPGDLSNLLPRGVDWMGRELAAIRRELRHRASMWKETYNVPGTLTALAGAARAYNRETHPLTIISVTASVATAPAGADLIMDVYKNGTSIYTTTANRPTIADGDHDTVAELPDDVMFDVDDYLTVAILQIGSTTAGAHLTFQIRAS